MFRTPRKKQDFNKVILKNKKAKPINSNLRSFFHQFHVMQLNHGFFKNIPFKKLIFNLNAN